jgi:hypothetical protein
VSPVELIATIMLQHPGLTEGRKTHPTSGPAEETCAIEANDEATALTMPATERRAG